ncbi:Secreted lipase [Sphaceloma murrayae]|uniref:Carboxylic ester hydrolase n=1 Tax=Sphaceloma murrayae TaxID=2082308 RepID=A0A2K1QIE8_9PEZI|nr:Secreted lipase [Sphaceloma murrayae]
MMVSWSLLPLLSICFALVSASVIRQAAPLNTSDPVAELSYGTFRGRYSALYNITYFRKIPFAAPPVGINRFRGPQPPIPITNGTFDSDRTYDMCPQRTVNGSEDCLYLGLYSRQWSEGQPLRPVLVNFYGGGFIQGGGSFAIPPAAYPILNVSVSNDYITVFPNYRVNAFGLLPGKAVADDPESDLNPGLLDQHAVLKWVNQHIRAFGGNADDVTIWGQSAGAGSVVAQSIANPELQQGLITRALASSPFWPHVYRYDSEEAEAIYETFASLAGCSGPHSLQCLKAADVQTLRNASLAISSSHTYNTSSYTWAPVIDDVFLDKPLSQAGGNIRANLAGGAFGMYNTHEGENFIPPGLQNAATNQSAPIGAGTSFNSSVASFEQWVTGFLPDLSSDQLGRLQDAYPLSGSTETIPSYNTSYIRGGLIYRDLILACPAYWLAAAFTTNTTTGAGYLGEYTISPAKHGSDTQYWNQVNAVQKSDPVTYEGMAGAFASWFAAGDPNARKLTNDTQSGPPILDNGEWVIRQGRFSPNDITQLRTRCDFWASIADNIPV